MNRFGFGICPTLQQVDRTYVLNNGRRLSYFGGCDYFRLASHPAIIEAISEGVRHYGLNVAASRATTGNHALYEELESRIAEFFGLEAATLVSTGYLTATAFAQAVAGEFSHVFIDRESHPCLQDSGPVFGATVTKFDHADPGDLRARIRRLTRCPRPLVLTDGVFGSNGKLAPLEAYLELLPKKGVILVDDAHGAGTLGKTGKGTLEELRISAERVIRTITLSKAFGVYGGAVLGSKRLCHKIRTLSSAFIGNTPLPLPLAAAALRSIAILREDPTLRQRLKDNTTYVKEAIKTVPSPAPIVAYTPANRERAEELRQQLIGKNIFPSLINYPGGPKSGFFRFAISSEHTRQQLTSLVEVLSRFTAPS